MQDKVKFETQLEYNKDPHLDSIAEEFSFSNEICHSSIIYSRLLSFDCCHH